MKLRLICCEVFFREACHLLAGCPHTCDPVFVPKGLHDLGAERMVARLQELVDAVPADYDSTVLGYGLCNNGVNGLRATTTRLVIPRAHDCIAVFLGDRQRYRAYFDAHPGTYYRTSGWYEREDASGAGEQTVPQKLGLFLQFDELVEKYGEENAQYIMETMGDSTAHYDNLAFIRMGLDCDEAFRARAIREAGERGWSFEELPGSLALLRKLLWGEWDEDILVLEPGQIIRTAYDDTIFRAEGDEGQPDT